MTRRRRRILLIVIASLALLAGVAAIGVVLVFRSGWFHEQVRARIVSEVEKATGGRTEIGSFQFDWHTLQARVAPFVLHGKEKPGEPAFVTAASVEVGLKIVSALHKDVNVASIVVERPEVHIIVYPDGSTNVPSPKVNRHGPPIAEQLLRLKARHFELHHGTVTVREERVPFDIRGDDLMASFDYDAAGPRYNGHVSSRQLHWEGRYIHPVAFDFDSDLALESEQLRIQKAVFVTGKSRLTASGSFHNWADPRVDVDFESHALIADVSKVVNLPIEPRGDADVRGKATVEWGKGFKFGIEGNLVARGLAYHDRYVHVAGVGARGPFKLNQDGVSMPRLSATALDGTFEGRVDLKDRYRRLEVEGTANNLALADLTRVTTVGPLGSGRPLAWSGVASGPVLIDGRIGPGRPHDFTVQTNMNIVQAPGAIPVQGNVDLIYDQRAGSLRLGNSTITTPSSQIAVSGTIGETLRATLRTKNLDDLLPGLSFVGADAPKQLPVKLAGGAATADVTVTGALATPTVAGHVTLGRFESQGRTFDSLAADVTASAAELTARNLVVTQGTTRLSGDGRIQLANWKVLDSSAVAATLEVRGADVPKMLAEVGQKLPVSGTAAASAVVRGTYASPQAAVKLTVDRPAAYGEKFDQLRADAQVDRSALQVKAGEVNIGRALVHFSGSYRPATGDWKSGAIVFDLAGSGLALDQFQHVRDYKSGLSAALGVKATGTASVRNAGFDLETLDSQVTLGGITRGGAPVGNLSLTAKTRDGSLEAKIDGAIRGSEVHGAGQWRLAGDYPGKGEIQFTPLTFASLHEMAAQGAVERELPFAGTLEGHATITGPLKKPDALQADIVLPQIQVTSNPNQPLRVRASGPDLVLRNTEPVHMVATLKTVNIQSAKFEAANTNLEAAGRVTFDAQSPWNVAVKGGVDLAILRLFNADITARGNATLDTTIRGALNDPQVSGRLVLRGASLYLADIPTGVDNANGTVNFDRNRANIETLTAEIGGGRVGFGGFIGFGGGILLYRVQATADQVRFRHPDGVSVTVNANMGLTGTSEHGLVSGTVTVMRAAFEPRADLSSLLAQTAKPLPAPSAPNEYLRGLNFDVRVESGPSLEVQTSLTRDLETEAELRLRGNAARPLLTGDISVSQGEIQFLGNKYTINRADVRFINPSKIEPAFDVDLETKARGITVNISFSGTLNKLNVTYRSDPPLQSSDIIALLAVGRDPTTAAFANAQTRSNLLESGAGTLSQAVAAPVSSRLQRFFGVSRLKIDPSLTGVENIPQARLTLEQQVSRDITLTYITNLTRTQEQIVRVQWDINRQWSAIAVREENGVFGVDFQYRKRFK